MKLNKTGKSHMLLIWKSLNGSYFYLSYCIFRQIFFDQKVHESQKINNLKLNLAHKMSLTYIA